MTTHWEEVAAKVGSLHENGETGGDSYAQAAFKEILGQQWIENTVEHAISFKPGREIAMNCLRYVHSKGAAFYAYRVYKTSQGERASQAVWLIKHLQHPVSFNWIEEFLNDDNVADWGVGVLDKLLWGGQIPYDDKAERLLKVAEATSHVALASQVEFVREYLKKREELQQDDVMNKRINISSGAVWEAQVGYSRAVKVGNQIEVSGTVASDEEGKVIGGGDAYLQTKYILHKIGRALAQAGASMNDVVRTRMFVTDISRFDEYAKAHGEVFGAIKPATSMIEVKGLVSPEYLIEVEATALLT